MATSITQSDMAPTTSGHSSDKAARHLQAPLRNLAIDAYRGFVMLLMMGEVLRFAAVARSHPESLAWKILAFNQTHVAWSGMSLHDTIQPSFTFLVGVALPYSVHSRINKGSNFSRLLIHTLWRSIVLIVLGILLRSLHADQINFTFEDTLTQIGLGYTFAFLITFCKPRWQWFILAGILFFYWLAWALYPAPSPSFDYPSVGVPPNWPHNFSGFASHWNKNSNLGQRFDLWFLNLFPRAFRFAFNGGGYLTLSFIPTLGTMLLGIIAGQWIRTRKVVDAIRVSLSTGAILIALGVALHFAGICPIVKRIWTPSWTLFSGGVCFLFLAFFCWAIDLRGYRKLAFPLVVVGTNSLAAYLIAHLWEDFLIRNLYTNFGHRPFQIFGTETEALVMGATVLLTYWLFLYWMYRRKIFLKI